MPLLRAARRFRYRPRQNACEMRVRGDTITGMNAISQVELAAMRNAPMFSALSEPALADLAATCQLRKYPADYMLFHQGQKAGRFFVVCQGQVKVFKMLPRGDAQVLHVFGPGETFGEAAMWAGDEYPAAAQTLTPATLLGVSRQGLVKAIERNGELALGMLAGMSAKLREFARMIESLSLKGVPARLAQLLMEYSAAAGASVIRLEQTKRELAAKIGTVPETLSRCLGKLKRDGVIAVRGSQITILQPQLLGELAENG